MDVVKRILLLGLLCLSGCLAFKNLTKEESKESFLVNLLWKCTTTKDLGNCLKLKAIKFLDKLVQMKEPLVITEYLSLARDPKASALMQQGLNESETKSLKDDEKSENLDKIIWDKLVSLFTTRTIQLSLSSDMFEGRGKEDKILKKGSGAFLMAAMMGGMMMKMALSKVALIAGKALVIGKIALVLSLIIALKKFISQTRPEVIYTSAELGGGRSFRDHSVWNNNGGDLAYSAQKPEV